MYSLPFGLPAKAKPCLGLVADYLQRLPIGSVGLDPVLLWCFEHHPRHVEKSRGLSPLFFEKRAHRQSYMLLVHFPFGEVDFSYQKGVRGFYARPSLHRGNVVNAARKAIEPQIYAWREANVATKGVDDVVDHAHPATFSALFDAFLTSRSLCTDSILLTDLAPHPGYRFSEEALLRAWQEYHRAHAVLRWLPRDLNLKIGARPYEATAAA